MIPQFRATREYYPGYQTIKLFKDAVVRRCLFIFASLFIVCCPFFIIRKFESTREAAIMVFLFIVAFPLAMRLRGGIRAAAWRWYACMVPLYCLGVIPVMLGASLLFHLFMIPAIYCAHRMHREAPEIISCLGYTGGRFRLREAAFALLASAILIFFSYLGVVKVNQTGFHLLPLEKYLLHLLIASQQYFIIIGILFGILSRRLFEMKFEPLIPILLNMMLMMFWWGLALLVGYKNIEVIIAGLTAACFLLNAILGMAYYYTRSTRLILFAYFLYSLVSISAIT